MAGLELAPSGRLVLRRVWNTSEAAMRATNVAIHVVPDDDFDDWIVREDGGPELGHFLTREAAELAAQNLVRKRGGALVIHLPDGRRESKRVEKGCWLVGSGDEKEIDRDQGAGRRISCEWWTTKQCDGSSRSWQTRGSPD
jgi:hypothetical protein